MPKYWRDDTGESTYIQPCKFTHAELEMHIQHLPGLVRKNFFFFKSLERFPSLGRSTQSQCAELSQKTGVRALRHYDDMTQGTTLSLETGTQRDSCQRLEPVYQWLAETQGPPRHAHMHIISLSLD